MTELFTLQEEDVVTFHPKTEEEWFQALEEGRFAVAYERREKMAQEVLRIVGIYGVA